MNIEIILVKKEEKEILNNILQKYLYEFSQYIDVDLNNYGLYNYKYLNDYWIEEKKYAYFIKKDGNLIGFLMINNVPEINLEMNYSITEFFITYKYRRKGIGKYVVNYILEKFKGKWQIKYNPKNEVSKIFWNKIVNGYTKGNYKIITDSKETMFNDGTIGEVLIFET